MRDGKAMLTPVTLGEALGDMRAVTKGLTAGEKVILSPTAELRDGDAVALAEG